MNVGKEPPSLLNVLLLHLFRDRITAPNAEAGIEHLAASADCHAGSDEWRMAVTEALAAGYVHDPVRLPAGALQCHWHLELTPQGVGAARLANCVTGH